MTQITLQNVRDQKTRDLMRGLLDRDREPQEFDVTLSRLLSTLQRSDLRAFDELLRKNQLFRHVKTLPEFPLDMPFKGNRGFSLVPAGTLAFEYVALRIAENEEQICKTFEKFELLNTALHSGTDEAIAASVDQVVKLAGNSLTLARKAAFVIGYAPKDSISYNTCAELLGAYGVNSNDHGMMVTIDAIGAEFNYLDLKYRFRDYATFERRASVSRKISQLCFAPLATTKDDLVALINASYEISLIDAAVALLSHQDEGIAQVAVPRSVENAWRKLASQPASAFQYLRKDDTYIDLWAFRSAPAFLEFPTFRRVRYAFQPLYDVPERGNTSGSIRAFSRQHAATFFEGIDRVADVVSPVEHPVFATPQKFDRETAGILSRTCALVWVCEKNADFSEISTKAMASLMGQTMEIDRLVSTELLRNAVRTASDPFVKLILQTLLRAHSTATLDNFKFKDQFQRYVRDHHNGDILDFMKMVQSLDNRIVSYFVNLLDETMLSQMAFLMASSEAIYDTRARLLEWYSSIANDPLAGDKAKQLRLDRKIAAVRGAINETRLNIDSVRFRQWIEQNTLSDFSDFIRQSQLILPPLSDLTDNSKKSTLFLAAHRDPAKLALQALVQCYEEFCRNPDYGIASFLGRRIRHGTVRGTLLNGLNDVSDLDHASLTQYHAWLRGFSTSIDSLASRLNFRSKTANKDGLLSAEIDSEQKWQLCLVCLTRMFTQAQQDQGVIVPLMIEQFCWLVFEAELAKVRSSIGEERSKWGTLKLHQAPSNVIATMFERRTNVTLGDHFTTVISWFRKPPNISPVAELAHVIQVVIAEAREEYATFSPAVNLAINDLELSGATYYVVYDALTIAVRNAAKHGQHPGKLSIEAKVKDQGPAKILEITVTSRLKADDDVALVLSRIEDAGRAGPTYADVVESLSGIRKLKKMAREGSILTFTPAADARCKNSLRMTIVMPFKGLVE